MATPVLLDSDIEKGHILLDELRKRNFSVSASFWHVDPDEVRFSLFLATPIVDEAGPLTAYKIVQIAMNSKPPSERVPADAVKVISQNEPLVKGLRGAGPLTNTWLYTTPLQGAYFNEGYVYFVNEPIIYKREPA